VRGRWYVADGGAPATMSRRDREAEQQRMGAVTLVQASRWGTRHGPAHRVESYLAYGQPVYSPCAGTVVAAVDGLIDQIPGAARFAPADGNHVLIDTGAEVIKLAHLRADSILVDVGERVHTKQLLGEVGNSGRSNQPRLTIAAVRQGRKLDLEFIGIDGNLYAGRTVEAGYR
jgi:murein DD-endopeptidase MepM/ murein hydrolase activator NlpD